jgi:hypothetical protein
MDRVGQRAGLTHPTPLKDVFAGVLKERHQAAHQVDRDTLLLELRSFPRRAMAVALAFDTLGSRAARLCRDGDSAYLSGRKVVPGDLALRFIEAAGRSFEEREEGSSTSTSHSTTNAARRAAITGALPYWGVVVQRDRTRTPVWWQTTDLG